MKTPIVNPALTPSSGNVQDKNNDDDLTQEDLIPGNADPAEALDFDEDDRDDGDEDDEEIIEDEKDA